MKMTFGQYRGHDIKMINSNYLKWLEGQGFMYGKHLELWKAIIDEINKRDDIQGHFYKDKISFKRR